MRSGQKIHGRSQMRVTPGMKGGRYPQRGSTTRVLVAVRTSAAGASSKMSDRIIRKEFRGPNFSTSLRHHLHRQHARHSSLCSSMPVTAAVRRHPRQAIHRNLTIHSSRCHHSFRCNKLMDSLRVTNLTSSLRSHILLSVTEDFGEMDYPPVGAR